MGVLLLGSVPTTDAQAQFGVVPSILLMEDPAGDVVAGSYSNPTISVPASEQTADLLSLSVAETPSALLVYLGVAAIPDESSPTSSQARASYSLAFRYADQDFVAYISAGPPGGATEAYRGSFCKGTWIQQETCTDGMHVSVLPSTKSFGIQIPKAALGELSGLQPTMGQALGSWRAQAQLARPIGTDLWVGDRLNDPIVDETVFTFQFGIPQSGSLLMSGEDLYIVSNGLATSYPFVVNLTNSLNQAQPLLLVAKKVPVGWQVTLPDAVVNVAPGGTQSVVIVLTVPFRHGHGAIERFIVEARGDEDQELASLDMGLIYTETPQPTGHHNVLTIHSFAGGRDGFFSTLHEDPSDSGEPIRGEMEPSGATLFNVSWNLELQPGLAVGLDFDLLRNGTLEVPVFTSVDTPGMHLAGSLDLQDAGGTTTLARIVPDGTADGNAQQTTTLSATVTMEPSADLAPYKEGAILVLHLVLASQLGAWTPNDIMPGGTFTLPLFDYHEDVDSAIESLSGLSWKSETSPELRGAPGSDVAVPLTLVTTTGEARRIRIQVDSSPEGIATFAGPSEGVVRADAPLAGQLVVTIPPDAFDGQLLNAVAVAQDQAGSGALAVYRVAIVVDTSVPSTRFSPSEEPGKESPLPLWAPIAAALVAVLIRRRTP